MRESVIYQEIIQEGVKQGLQQGKREEALSYTMRLLTRRLGAVKPKLQAPIQELTITQLEELGEALLDFTDTKDLVAWLELHQQSQ